MGFHKLSGYQKEEKMKSYYCANVFVWKWGPGRVIFLGGENYYYLPVLDSSMGQIFYALIYLISIYFNMHPIAQHCIKLIINYDCILYNL